MSSVALSASRLRVGDRLDRLPVSPWLAKVMVILFLGWLVESYDIGLTGSLLDPLKSEFGMSTGQESLFAVAANAGIVLGIVPAGRLADRFGRKGVMVVGTIVYAVLSLATAFVPSLDAVIMLRLLAGLAMGAVFPLPYAYGSEFCPPQLRGKFTALADAFLSVGYFVAPLLAAVVIGSFGNAVGWRVMFAIGVIPLAFAAIAARYLPESPRWYEIRGRYADAQRVLTAIEDQVRARTGKELPDLPDTHQPQPAQPPRRVSIGQLLGGAYRRRTLALSATFGGLFFVFYSIQTFMPKVVSDLGFSLTSSFVFTAIIVVVSIPGKLAAGWLLETWGRKPVLIIFGSIAAAAAVVFGFSRGAAMVLVIGGLLSFFGIGVDPAVKSYTAESFPTELRATGTSVVEGFGRLLSGVIGPSFVPLLLVVGGVPLTYVIVGAVALLAVGVVALFGHETRGRSLESASSPSL